MNHQHRARDLVVCSLFTALIAVGAFIKISIPIEPFPMHFTLQLFFVLLAGILLGPKLGSISVGIYLLLGLIGIPIFAAGGGLSYLIRPTFGFLLGFLLTALLSGLFIQKRPRAGFLYLLFASVCGTLVSYAAGMLYFYLISNYVIYMPVTWGIVFVNCFLITIPGDLVLCLLTSLLTVKLRPSLQHILRIR